MPEDCRRTAGGLLEDCWRTARVLKKSRRWPKKKSRVCQCLVLDFLCFARCIHMARWPIQLCRCLILSEAQDVKFRI